MRMAEGERRIGATESLLGGGEGVIMDVSTRNIATS